MKTNKTTTLLNLSKKKLNVFDTAKLYKILQGLESNDLALLKLFLDNYYSINSLPEDFYKMFLYCVHSNRYKELFGILLNKNIYSLIGYLKNDNEKIMAIEDLISPSTYFELSTKQIRDIVNLLKSIDLANEKLSLKKAIANKAGWLLRKTNINTDEEFREIAIKMFLSIGIDNAIDILSGKYGEVDYEIIHYLFNNLNVKYSNDKHNTIFNDFLFSNKKDPNNNMRLMLEGNFPELFLNFDYFYNSLSYFIENLGAKLNKSKVAILLAERYIAPKIKNPELSGVILDDMISSYYHKYGISDSETEILDKNINAYNEKLKTKTGSSILNTDIPKIGDYTFELLALTDARNLVIGYRAGNCFRINGDAFILFNNFLTNPHMRILSISTEEYKDFGMVLLMRNGNVLIAQGIELSKRIPYSITGKNLYNSVQTALKYIMDAINKEDDEIVASIIGLSNNNTTPYNHNILPFIINPILDNNHQYYNGVENYQGLLDLKEGKTINDIRLFTPCNIYHERESKTYVRDDFTPRNSLDFQEIEKILISLRNDRFKANQSESLFSYYRELATKKELYTICTLYWYITTFEDGSVDTYINSNNPEVVKEYNLKLKEIKKI